LLKESFVVFGMGMAMVMSARNEIFHQQTKQTNQQTIYAQVCFPTFFHPHVPIKDNPTATESFI